MKLETEHFRLVYFKQNQDVKKVAKLLEKTYQEFPFNFREPKNKLICIYFPDEKSFEKYSKKTQSAYLNPKLIDGFYSTLGNTIVFHPRIDRYDHITHEVAHQLSFNTGLFSRGFGKYSLVLLEGLATNFEVQDNGDMGLDTLNVDRYTRLVWAAKHGCLLSIRELMNVKHNSPILSKDRVKVFYAESWFVFQWLYKHHKKKLLKYIKTKDCDNYKKFIGFFGPSIINKLEKELYNEVLK